ncbi:MAG TPA: hypothetical protein VGC19_05755 [Rhodanobacter sp.]
MASMTGVGRVPEIFRIFPMTFRSLQWPCVHVRNAPFELPNFAAHLTAGKKKKCGFNKPGCEKPLPCKGFKAFMHFSLNIIWTYGCPNEFMVYARHALLLRALGRFVVGTTGRLSV